MKTSRLIKYSGLLMLFGACHLQLSPLFAQGTAFTYQGRLTDGANPAKGGYDIEFYLRDASLGGNPVGTTNIWPLVTVSNGLFTVPLDFGAGIFTGSGRWLEIGVRTNGSVAPYTILTPRQSLTPSPYALFAGTAASATNVSAGVVVKSINGLHDNVVLSQGANVTLATNGSNLTISSTGGGVFSLNGTNAYYSGGNIGVGTSTPGAALQLASGGLAVTGDGSPYSGKGVYLGSTPASGNLFAYDYSLSAPRPLTLQLAGGNVGIGTSTPGAALHVASGGLAVTGDGSPYSGKGVFLGSTPASANVFAYDYSLSAPQPLTLQLPGGNVGVGTATPGAALHVASGGLAVTGDGSPYSGKGVYLNSTPVSGNVFAWDYDVESPRPLTLQLPGGFVGIGTASPDAPLNIRANQGYETIESDNTIYGSVLQLWNHTSGPNVSYGAINFGDGNNTPGQISYGIGTGLAFTTGGNLQATLFENGTFSVKVLQINGADVAEPFKLSSKDLPKGSVVVIDEENPGQVKLSDRAYDKKVAGILSGANGVHPGIRLKQDGFNDDGEEVALSGRVYALADAACGEIKPGDLLTTSDTPGHCMKVIDGARAQGAIIGKAMSPLKDGKGMVLVLVSLQ